MPTVQSAGVPIHYELIGTGTPILLVHGFLSSFEGNWRQSGWIDFLLGQGRQVVGMDCRGHGRSGKPHHASAYVGNQIPDDVIAVMDTLGLDRVDSMGYSMGGRIAVNLLARFPHRFTSVVVGGAGLGYGPPDLQGRAATVQALETDDVSTITDPTALLFRQLAESRQTDPTSLAGRDNDLKALAAITRSDDWMHAEHDDALRRVQVPVLAVAGDQDPRLANARKLIETVPQGELVVLPGDDHLSAVRSPKYKEVVASFLQPGTQGHRRVDGTSWPPIIGLASTKRVPGPDSDVLDARSVVFHAEFVAIVVDVLTRLWCVSSTRCDARGELAADAWIKEWRPARRVDSHPKRSTRGIRAVAPCNSTRTASTRLTSATVPVNGTISSSGSASSGENEYQSSSDSRTDANRAEASCGR
jgi:pimeloyl-ACP methyl ester carboxylesterase